jgi:hypothetical protein
VIAPSYRYAKPVRQTTVRGGLCKCGHRRRCGAVSAARRYGLNLIYERWGAT